ncbi:hypothetical protein DXG01_014368 [Tephrocybe rancida]|nr:hypothetical protein DXG01_014368 [Tephrocybe rancida]
MPMEIPFRRCSHTCFHKSVPSARYNFIFHVKGAALPQHLIAEKTHPYCDPRTCGIRANPDGLYVTRDELLAMEEELRGRYRNNRDALADLGTTLHGIPYEVEDDGDDGDIESLKWPGSDNGIDDDRGSQLGVEGGGLVERGMGAVGAAGAAEQSGPAAPYTQPAHVRRPAEAAKATPTRHKVPGRLDLLSRPAGHRKDVAVQPQAPLQPVRAGGRGRGRARARDKVRYIGVPRGAHDEEPAEAPQEPIARKTRTSLPKNVGKDGDVVEGSQVRGEGPDMGEMLRATIIQNPTGNITIHNHFAYTPPQ